MYASMNHLVFSQPMSEKLQGVSIAKEGLKNNRKEVGIPIY